MNRPPIVLEAALWPLACVYRAAMNARNFSFDRGLLPSFALPAPVVSIGNLTAGGTGKTPLTARLLEGFLQRGRSVGVVSRGYGGANPGPSRVPARGGSAGEFGDEPLWLAGRFPGIPVVIGRDRVAAVRALLDLQRVDLVFADDAFQHRRLRRAFDIVVLDATEPEWHYRPLPLGRMREGFESLARAQAVVITKSNLAGREELARLRARIIGPMVFEVEAALAGFFALTGEPAEPPKTALLASGIGRPEGFVRLLEGSVQIKGHEIFPDHHLYSAADLERIEEQAKRVGAGNVVVTEKDAVKLAAWRPGALKVCAARMEFRGDLEGLYAAIDRLVT